MYGSSAAAVFILTIMVVGCGSGSSEPSEPLKDGAHAVYSRTADQLEASVERSWNDVLQEVADETGGPNLANALNIDCYSNDGDGLNADDPAPEYDDWECSVFSDVVGYTFDETYDITLDEQCWEAQRTSVESDFGENEIPQSLDGCL